MKTMRAYVEDEFGALVVYSTQVREHIARQQAIKVMAEGVEWTNLEGVVFYPPHRIIKVTLEDTVK